MFELDSCHARPLVRARSAHMLRTSALGFDSRNSLRVDAFRASFTSGPKPKDSSQPTAGVRKLPWAKYRDQQNIELSTMLWL